MAPSVATTWKPTRSVVWDLAVSRQLQRSVIAFTSHLRLPGNPFQTACFLPMRRVYERRNGRSGRMRYVARNLGRPPAVTCGHSDIRSTPGNPVLGSNHRVAEAGRSEATAQGMRDRLVAPYRSKRVSGHERGLGTDGSSAPLGRSTDWAWVATVGA